MSFKYSCENPFNQNPFKTRQKYPVLGGFWLKSGGLCGISRFLDHRPCLVYSKWVFGQRRKSSRGFTVSCHYEQFTDLSTQFYFILSENEILYKDIFNL